MSSNLRPSAHVEGMVGFDGTIAGVWTEVGQYGGTGANSGTKKTQVTVKLRNDDEPTKERKFDEEWNVGNPTVVLPSLDGINAVGEGEKGTTICDAKDNTRDPLINKKSVYSQITNRMISVGCPEDELPEATRTTDPSKDFRRLIGLRFHWELGETDAVGDSKAKKLVPTKFLGRVAIDAAIPAAAQAGVAPAAAPAANLDVNKVLSKLVAKAVLARNPLPAQELTKAVVPALTGEYAGIKNAAIVLLVTEPFKKGLEQSVGVTYDGKQFAGDPAVIGALLEAA